MEKVIINSQQQLFQQMPIAPIFRYTFYIEYRQIESIDTWSTYKMYDVRVQRSALNVYWNSRYIYLIFNISVLTGVTTHSVETESYNSKRKKKCWKPISRCRQTDPNIERLLNVVSFGNAFIVLACERIKYKSRVWLFALFGNSFKLFWCNEIHQFVWLVTIFPSALRYWVSHIPCVLNQWHIFAVCSSTRIFSVILHSNAFLNYVMIWSLFSNSMLMEAAFPLVSSAHLWFTRKEYIIFLFARISSM